MKDEIAKIALEELKLTIQTAHGHRSFEYPRLHGIRLRDDSVELDLDPRWTDTDHVSYDLDQVIELKVSVERSSEITNTC